MFNTLIKYYRLIGFWLLLLVTACVHQPEESRRPVDKVLQQTVSAQEPLPQAALQQLLAANIAYFTKQDWRRVSSALVDAAQLLDNPQVYASYAKTALTFRDYNAALLLSKRWLDQAPEEESALLIATVAYIGLGQVQSALPLANKLLQHNPQTGFVRLGRLLREQSNVAAVSLVEILLAQHARSEVFLFNAASVAIWFRQPMLARRWLDDALQRNANYQPAILLRYELLKMQEGETLALAYLYDRAKQLKQAYSVQMRLLNEWYRRGEYQQILVFAELLDVTKPKKAADINYYRARSYIQLGDYPAATDVLLETLAKLPEYQPAMFYLGWLAFYEKRDAAAMHWFSQISADQGNLFFEANMMIARSRVRQMPGELGMQRALRQLNVVEPITRDDFIRHAKVRDDILHANQRYLRAFAYMSDALVMYPNDAALLYRRALSASYLDEIDVAEADLKQVLAYRPNDSAALNTLGYVLAEHTQRYAEAEAYIERALALQPNDAHILDSMGWVLFKQGKYQQAQTFLQQSYKIARHPEVAAHFGEVLYVLKKTSEAIKLFRQAIQTHPENSVLLETIKRLGITEL